MTSVAVAVALANPYGETCMADPEERFKINLNQNLWGLVVGFAALGAAEKYRLCALFWPAVVLSAIMTLSVAVTTVAYTVNYCRKKFT